MDKKPTIFDNIGVRCETWEQMEKLAEIAKSSGYKEFSFEEEFFHRGGTIFWLDKKDHDYTNCDDKDWAGAPEPIISFSDIDIADMGLSWPDVLKEAHDYAEKRPAGTKYRDYRDEYLKNNFVIRRK